MKSPTRHPFADGVINAVEPALAETRKIERRFAQRLRRHRAGIKARAAQMRGALDERDALAEIGRLRRAFFSGRAGTDGHQIEALHGASPMKTALQHPYKFLTNWYQFF